ncbi:hypothetical protein BJ138DRAFT_1129242 [Hygrophoropsis aurantiaca]|uniref:Uncharacterized protein n=1 Tax=Hygrophoropsis aurantiaca TaxID=72124 RepID=A0ACB8A2C5_9AGAM|nr:hypothetical protein BJ138DRAFT_1129242 [Hygrophoropsis aurantiaca]
MNPPTSSTATSTTILGKRKATKPLVLHLSSASSTSSDFEPEATPPRKKTTKINTITNSNPRARYRCTFPDCLKSYTKPSRLAEHARAHTGERPYGCDVCGKAYFRETHLQAHAHSHRPESERPYMCGVGTECGKRFWTAQHLKVHEAMHGGAKNYACTDAACGETFSKHHQLRAHMCTVHAPPGTKPYQCTSLNCGKSFATNQKLRAHLKTHDEKRYTCSHPSCLVTPTPTSSDASATTSPSSHPPAPTLTSSPTPTPISSGTPTPTPTPTTSTPTFYSTWSALQSHIRTAHPPTCAVCGRTYASHANLRTHARLHEQREVEMVLEGENDSDGDDDDGGDSDGGGEVQKRRRGRRGGEVGRDWKCDFEACGKDFKSKKALATHHKVIHLGRRDHVCPHTHCTSAFGYKHLLQRHLAKIHSASAAASTSNQAPTSHQGRRSATSESESEHGREHADQEGMSAPESDGDVAPSTNTNAVSTNINAIAAATTQDADAFDIDFITGRTYSQRFHASNAKAIHCPWPDLGGFGCPTVSVSAPPGSGAEAGTTPTPAPAASSSNAIQTCAHILTRAYDLRRHLRAEHGVEVGKERVDAWVSRRGRAG